MSEILMGGGSLRGFDAETLHGMLTFRHHVFLDKLGWDVATQDDLEFDLFDIMTRSTCSPVAIATSSKAAGV